MTSVPQDLLLDLYSRVEDPLCWGAVLDRVCADLGVRSAVVQRMNAGNDDCASTTWLVRDSYSEENSAVHDAVVADSINPRMRVSHLPPNLDNKPVLSDKDFPGLAGPNGNRFREALRSIGLGSFMSSGAKLPNGDRIAVVLHKRVDDRNRFGAAEQDYLWQLARHLSQAAVLGDRLEQERRRGDALGSTLEKLRYGVALCEASGRLIWASSRARELLAQHPAFRASESRIACATQRDTRILEGLFNLTVASGSPLQAAQRVAIGIRRGSPLHCIAVPLEEKAGAMPSESGAGKWGGRIALFLSSPGLEPELDPEALQQLLGLSPAEARVAVAICSGTTIKEYAALRGVSEGTVRFQLKQVLAKSGTGRQVDFVRFVFSSLAAEIIPGSR